MKNRKRKTWDNIVLSDSSRGYGSCTRISDTNTSKAIDVCVCYGEYQRDVCAVEGDFEKISLLLDQQQQKTRQALVNLLGSRSCCDLHRTMTLEQLTEVVKAMAEPLPRNEIIEESQKYMRGKITCFDVCDHIFDLNYMLGYKKGEWHKFGYVLRMQDREDTKATSYKNDYGEVRAIKILYPEDAELIDAVEKYTAYRYRNR